MTRTILATELVPGTIVVDETGSRRFASFDVSVLEDVVLVWTAVSDQEVRGLDEKLELDPTAELLVLA